MFLRGRETVHWELMGYELIFFLNFVCHFSYILEAFASVNCIQILWNLQNRSEKLKEHLFEHKCFFKTVAFIVIAFDPDFCLQGTPVSACVCRCFWKNITCNSCYLCFLMDAWLTKTGNLSVFLKTFLIRQLCTIFRVKSRDNIT